MKWTRKHCWKVTCGSSDATVIGGGAGSGADRPGKVAAKPLPLFRLAFSFPFGTTGLEEGCAGGAAATFRALDFRGAGFTGCSGGAGGGTTSGSIPIASYICCLTFGLMSAGM